KAIDPHSGGLLRFHCHNSKEGSRMREPGLAEAIRAAGGISELARQIGISQPSVSNWIRVPAERVVSVEAVTGIDRTVLRPDLYYETGRAHVSTPVTSLSH